MKIVVLEEPHPNEIAGLLTLFTAIQSGFVTAAGLCSRVSSRTSDEVAIASDGKSWHAAFGRRDHIYFFKANDSTTRHALMDSLRSSQLQDVVAVLTHSPNPHAHIECRDAIANAVKHLAAGLCVNERNEILSNSVTCFDLLLKGKQGVQDKQVQKRLRALTGEPKEPIQRIYHARNGWLHDGRDVSADQAREGISVAIVAIAAFAKLVTAMPKLTERLELVNHLDALQ